MNELPRTVVKDRDGGRVEGVPAPLVPAETRYSAQRRRVRRWIIVCAVVLVVGVILSVGVEFAFPGLFSESIAEQDYLAVAVAILAPFFIPLLVWFLWVHPFRPSRHRISVVSLPARGGRCASSSSTTAGCFSRPTTTM